jgi:hypothetical protein
VAISPAGCCQYRVALTRSTSGPLGGRAEPSRDADRHPGICAPQPDISLEGNTVLLRSTWSGRLAHRLRPHGVRNFGPPASEVRLKVGAAFGTIAQEGDRLEVARGGTAEIALALFRGEDLQIAAGALEELDLSGVAIVEDDPRIGDHAVYGVFEWLASPGRELLWVNADENPDHAVAEVFGARGRDLVIAIAGSDPVARRNLNRRLSPLLTGGASRWVIEVDDRFSCRQQWEDYIRSLPRTPPLDLWLRVRIGDTVVTLHEGEYAAASPWQLYLVRVSREGLPGSRSQLAIARQCPGLTRDVLIDSTDRIADGGDILINK